MEIIKLKEDWGLRIDGKLEEVLSLDLRSLGYRNDLLVFSGLGNIDYGSYYKLISKFGKPWTKEDYLTSDENSAFNFDYGSGKGCLTRMSNKISRRLGTIAMPWHADIPLHGAASFPWRSLYMVSNPNPEAGLTIWMNLRLNVIRPSADDLDLWSRMSVLNQSWHENGTPDTLNSFIKEDPITGEKSLRANYFHVEGRADKPWIKKTFIDGNEVDNKETLGGIYKELSMRNELVYAHKWNLYDLVIYNNQSLVHRRTALELKEGESREFLRANIHHL